MFALNYLWYRTILTSILSGLIGAAIVYYFGIRQLYIRRSIDFIEKQLCEFYSPLAGWRKRIRAKSEFRKKVSEAADEALRDKCNSYCNKSMLDQGKQFEPYQKIIEYDNKQLENELIPLYRKMLNIFTDKYWLADSDTKAFYQRFLEFVEIWDRSLSESLPIDVISKLKHDEKVLFPFYDHLENKLQQLQDQIADRKRWWKRLI